MHIPLKHDKIPLKHYKIQLKHYKIQLKHYKINWGIVNLITKSWEPHGNLACPTCAIWRALLSTLMECFPNGILGPFFLPRCIIHQTWQRKS